MAMSYGFGLFSALFPLLFLVVLFIFVVVFFRGIRQWHRNNNSPKLTVEAKVVDKRSDYHIHDDGIDHTGSSFTYYYATFEVESGDRIEFSIPDNQFGYLVVGDRGRLTFQGTRFLSFARS